MAILKINREKGMIEVKGKRHPIVGFELKSARVLRMPFPKVIVRHKEKENGKYSGRS